MQGNFIMASQHPLPLTYQDYFFNILGIKVPYNPA